MTASLRSESLARRAEAKTATGRQHIFPLAAVVAIAAGGLAAWSAFDHSLPVWDGAGHLLNGLSYRELFRHPKPFDLHWYHQLLTVNCFYPPFTYVLAGLVKTVMGTALWTDAFMKVLYLTILNVSVYGLVTKLTKDRPAAIFSVVLVNLYPEVAVESHKSMLDFPVMSMTALALFALAWWNEKQSWKRTAVLALATGCALMTKQVCAAFLVLPFAMLALYGLKQRQAKPVAMLVSAGLSAGAMLLPWLILSMPTIKKVAAEIQVALGNKAVSDVFFSNLVAYIKFLPAMATPVLLLFALAAIVFAKRETHRQLAMLSFSFLSAIILLSTLTWQYALPRYFISGLIVFAAYSGVLLASLWRSGKPVQRSVPALVLAAGLLGYVSINFYPHPIPQQSALDLVRSMALHPVSADTKDRFEHPCPNEDWGIFWTLDRIKETEGNAAVWLNVLPSTQQLNVHTFEYYGRQGKYEVRPTTSRSWSAAGDSARFNEEEALHYQWYLVKTGEQGFKFHDPASRANFNRLVSFIASGGRFELKGEKQLPDGSHLKLYRQR